METIIALIIAFRIVGTALLAIKLIGTNKNKIIKRCLDKSIIFENGHAYILKTHYLDMLKENLYASIGIGYMIISELINLFVLNTGIKADNFRVAFITLIISMVLNIFAIVIVKITLKIKSKEENHKIIIDDSLIEDGTQAIEIFDDIHETEK